MPAGSLYVVLAPAAPEPARVRIVPFYALAKTGGPSG